MTTENDIRKATIRGAVGLGVLLILYILIAFLIPFAKTAVFWVSFLFTVPVAIDVL